MCVLGTPLYCTPLSSYSLYPSRTAGAFVSLPLLSPLHCKALAVVVGVDSLLTSIRAMCKYNTRLAESLQVQQVAWHPNGLVLATACTDFKCRVVSAIVEEVRPFLI